jgi:hypothetical protein
VEANFHGGFRLALTINKAHPCTAICCAQDGLPNLNIQIPSVHNRFVEQNLNDAPIELRQEAAKCQR